MKQALIAIVAAHVGDWAPGQALATAWAAALEISSPELKRQLALSPANLWTKTVAHLEELAGTEWWNNGERLAELYAAIPAGMKERAGLML